VFALPSPVTVSLPDTGSRHCSQLVINQEGYVVETGWDRYVRNSLNTVADTDGVVRVHLGGDPDAPNHLPVFGGWMNSFRMYLPLAEILEGRWDSPACVPVR
jgi:hypothetical protein